MSDRIAGEHERSDLSHWRTRLGDKLELLVAESLRVVHESGALRSKDLECNRIERILCVKIRPNKTAPQKIRDAFLIFPVLEARDPALEGRMLVRRQFPDHRSTSPAPAST
jgi:hypothetical protein